MPKCTTDSQIQAAKLKWKTDIKNAQIPNKLQTQNEKPSTDQRDCNIPHLSKNFNLLSSNGWERDRYYLRHTTCGLSKKLFINVSTNGSVSTDFFPSGQTTPTRCSVKLSMLNAYKRITKKITRLFQQVVYTCGIFTKNTNYYTKYIE